jgi:hypothetical protein
MTLQTTGHPFYSKVMMPCAPDQFGALMRTLQRDYEGIWPATEETALEICALDNERFDDPFLYAGWVIYTLPADADRRAVVFDPYYAAATIELFDLPGKRVSVYFTDGQEAGPYPVRSIGKPFCALVDLILARSGVLAAWTPSELGIGRLHSVTDQLILKWLKADSTLTDRQIGRRLRLVPERITARRSRLVSQGLLS